VADLSSTLMRPSVLDVAVTRLTARIPPALRRWLEGALVALMGAVLSYRTLPALRDRGQAFYNDVTTQALGPDRHGLAQLLRDGVWPSWLRSAYGGEPYLANSQHGVLYPGNLPFWLIRHTGVALDMMIWAHLVLAFLGAWFLVRVAWRRGFWAGAVAAVLFGLGSQLLTHTVLGDQLQGTALAPWVLAATHLALDRGRLRHVVGFSVATGLQFLAGHPEMWLYTLGMCVTYALAWTWRRDPEGTDPPWWRRLVHVGVRIGGGVALFVGLFSWQLLPTLQLQSLGYRSTGLRQQYPLPVASGVDALLPDYGRVLVGENQAFVGVLGLVLFCLGLVCAGRAWRWLVTWLAVMAALGYTMALGNSNAFYRFLYHHAPLLSSFRVPSRWLLLTNLAFALGAALGVDALLRSGRGATIAARLRERSVTLALAVGVAAIGTGFAFLLADSRSQGASDRRWLLALVAGLALWLLCTVPAVPRALVGLTLIAVAYKELSLARPLAEYRQMVPNAVYDDYGTNLQTIAAQGGRYLANISNGGLNGPATEAQRSTTVLPEGLTGPGANYYRVAMPQRYFGVPNSQLGAGAESLLGRDGGLVPTARWRDLYVNATGAIGDINGGRQVAQPSQLRWDALDLLGIEWYLAGNDLAPGQAEVLTSHGFTKVGSAQYVDRWHRTAPPLARLLHAVDVVPGAKGRAAKLKAGYPLLSRALVEEAVTVAAPVGGESVQMGRPGRTTVRLRAEVTSPALLVLADPIYPGWQVRVDGRRAHLLAVDSGLRGVALTPGVHRVEFRYVDGPFRRGLALLGLSLLGLILIGLRGGVRGRRRAHLRPRGPSRRAGRHALR
jgi:hypothetical protein